MKFKIHTLAITISIGIMLASSALALDRNYVDKKFEAKFGETLTKIEEIENTKTLRYRGTLTLDTSLTKRNGFYLHVLPLEGNLRIWVQQADHNPVDGFYHFKRLSSRTKSLDIEIEQIKPREKETSSSDNSKLQISFEIRSGLLPKAGSKELVVLDKDT